ncbi:unnamed protein product [Vitrella brassicaformis CCMP3155]|uniref:peptidylprolyl isomerase n=2 Tax=Vitrella brassicaformis TaxID=1169539 RepID=A0A0G4FHS8_VITBC|nr:unnamed protein product [Vitrella brassicaformis CCMP3155]|eukprot:CEM12627.1 unnamed protein product [Vitrella brassicaformis CCMP3155]
MSEGEAINGVHGHEAETSAVPKDEHEGMDVMVKANGVSDGGDAAVSSDPPTEQEPAFKHIATVDPMDRQVDLIHQANGYKKEGNELFGSGNYKEALKKYHHVFLYVNGFDGKKKYGHMLSPELLQDNKLSGPEITESEIDVVKQLKVLTYQNMAACHFKLENYRRCIDCATSAIELDDTSVKAHFRRAQAYIEQGRLDQAMDDLHKAKQIAPNDASIVAEMKRCKQLSKEQEAKSKETMKKAWQKMERENRRKTAKKQDEHNLD